MKSPSELPPPEIFKAYDIRGIVDRSLTIAGAELIGRAVGSEARDRGVSEIVTARDGRLSGPALQAALNSGLVASGCRVVDIGMAPTPVLYFAAYQMQKPSGVMVTGSHNPPDYNGFKMMLAGETLAGETITALRERMAAGRLQEGTGSLETRNVLGDYLERVRSDIHLARPLKVVVDCGNGVAGMLAGELLRAIGAEVQEMFCDVDGNFPNHHPDPSQAANLEDLRAALAAGNHDLGLAFDGDGDRLGVMAPDGTIIWPDRQLILFARDVLSRNPGAEILYDVKCSRTVPEAVEAAGGRATMCKTGHSFIKAKLQETGAALAGEMSGHIFFSERWYGFDDGLYAAARLLELLASDSRTPQQVFASLPDTVNTPELQIRMTEGENHALIPELVARADFPGARTSTLDGLRVDFADGFGLIRASNTTPVLVLRFEGSDAAALARIQDKFRRLILDTRPGLELPF
ncbi:MAG: phosphomannomutase/phosphoglucomutase [Gammaproteobacteria bacterium]|nr:phosphomannomutase/phosphoglucomutase [Gammaproteobacteria bacterium]